MCWDPSPFPCSPQGRPWFPGDPREATLRRLSPGGTKVTLLGHRFSARSSRGVGSLLEFSAPRHPPPDGLGPCDRVPRARLRNKGGRVEGEEASGTRLGGRGVGRRGVAGLGGVLGFPKLLASVPPSRVERLFRERKKPGDARPGVGGVLAKQASERAGKEARGKRERGPASGAPRYPQPL